VAAVSEPVVARIGHGVYRVEQDGNQQIVYVAGTANDRWAFWNGRVFRIRSETGRTPARAAAQGPLAQSLTAPMPATILQVLVEPGSVLKKGDTVLILEAMKMELPIRADRDSVVKAVHCRAGQLVQPDTVLVELS
jgi:biotin carboxyl carrier protein